MFQHNLSESKVYICLIKTSKCNLKNIEKSCLSVFKYVYFKMVWKEGLKPETRGRLQEKQKTVCLVFNEKVIWNFKMLLAFILKIPLKRLALISRKILTNFLWPTVLKSQFITLRYDLTTKLSLKKHWITKRKLSSNLSSSFNPVQASSQKYSTFHRIT